MNADSLTQIDEVRTGNVSDRHAWLLAELWRAVWPLGVGTVWVLTATVISFVVGSYLVLRAALGPIAAASGAAVVALLPQNFGALGLLGRDMWFTALLLLAFGMLVYSAEQTGRVRTALLAGSVAAAVLAQSSRQNSITAMVIFFLACALVVAERGSKERDTRWPRCGAMRRVGTFVLAGFASTIAVAGALAVMKPALGVKEAHSEQWLYIYDLAALSERQDRLLLGPEAYPANDLRLLEERFTPDNVTTIVVPPNPVVPTPLSERGLEEVSEEWREAVFGSPVDYLAVRWNLFLRQIAVTQPPTQVYHPVIDGNSFGFTIRFPGANGVAKGYVEAFADDRLNGNLLHATWLYLLISLVAAVILLSARRIALKLVGLMALTAIAYQAGLFLGAMGVGLRLEDPVRPVALLAAIVAAVHFVEQRREAPGQLGRSSR